MERQRREATNTTSKMNVVLTANQKDVYQRIAHGGGRWLARKTSEETEMDQAEQHSKEKTRGQELLDKRSEQHHRGRHHQMRREHPTDHGDHRVRRRTKKKNP